MIRTKLNYKCKEICFFFILFLFFSVTTSSYGQQINCPNDFDCDGIIDALDADDDNDGIYDHIESPNCFVFKETYETGDRRELLTVTTGLTFTTGTTDLLIDGLTTAGNGITIAANTALTDKEIFRTTTRGVLGIEYTSVTMTFNGTYFFTATSRVILQGSQDGVVWTELTDIIAPAVATIDVTIPVTKNQGTYRMYRLMGTAGSTWTGAARIFLELTGTVGSYVPSLYPKANCEGEDIDNDGKPNHQDLDADGDGASDVLEVGFNDGDKDGMLGSSPVTVDQFGAVTSAKGYTLPANNYYKSAAINAVIDTDDDGILDIFDVDDDNDGIYDHIESPNCFETNKTVYETGDRRELLAVRTGLPFTAGTPDLLVDGLTTNLSGIMIPAVPVLKGQEIVRVSTQLAFGVEYSAVTLNFTTAFFTTTSRVILQGSKDGVNWTDLSESVAPGNTLAATILVTKNQGLYGAYRLMGDAGGGSTRASFLSEITGTIGSYMPSLYPKTTCTGEDIDNDGKPNHLDLDTDGDGDSDVIEAGFIDGDKDGKLGTSPVTVNDVGAVTSGKGYTIPLEFYKMPAVTFTKDTDGDGVVDIFDGDDDDDGIYDHIESPNCFEIYKRVYETEDRRELLAVTTGLPFTTGTADLLIDGLTTDTSGITIVAGTVLTDKEIFRTTTRASLGIEYTSVTMTFSAANFFATTARVILQGSQDGVIWTELTDVITPARTIAVRIPVTKNQGTYRMYRLMGTVGSIGATTIVREITGTVGEFVPYMYPKMDCTSDLDKDGKLNHQDLNSDGDSCNDVLEAGFLDQDNDGMLGMSPVTVNQHGIVTSAVGYITPNNLYYLDASKNVCTGEGIPIDEDSHCLDMENITNDYGLVQSVFHSSIVRTKTGFSIFGEYSNPKGGLFNVPVAMIPANGFTYEGTIIATTLGGVGDGMASNQFFVLSTEGLYTWGSKMGTCIPASWTRSVNFEKIELPMGILPKDVKFMSASLGNLVILTKSGDVYVAGVGYYGYLAYGDGSTVVDNLWHKSNINQVISIKINSYGQAMALTNSGELYTWGDNVILGNGTPAQDLLLPTRMTLPASIATVKMIALTNDRSNVVYYVLGNDKRVYSLGGNRLYGLLGIGEEGTTQLNWQTVKGPGGIGYLENIKFINAGLHDSSVGTASAINEKGTPYLWGNNPLGLLGSSTQNVLFFPRIPDRKSIGDYDIIYIENGGHVTPMLDQTLGKFGYVGHRVNGSMGDGSIGDSFIYSYDFDDTPIIDFCNLIIGGRKVTRVMVNPAIINSKPAKQ